MWLRYNDRIVDMRSYFAFVPSDRDEAIGAFYSQAEALCSGEIDPEDFVADERKIRGWDDWRQRRIATGYFDGLSPLQQLWASYYRVVRPLQWSDTDVVGDAAELAGLPREEIEDRLEGRQEPDGLIVMRLQEIL